jgi:hypothetical protein
MLQRMDSKFLMALKDHKIMSVSLMVAEEKVLAMYRVYFLPVLEGKLDGRKGRMGMKLIAEAMLLKEVQDLGNSDIFHYLDRLFA